MNLPHRIGIQRGRVLDTRYAHSIFEVGRFCIRLSQWRDPATDAQYKPNTSYHIEVGWTMDDDDMFSNPNFSWQITRFHEEAK